MDNFMKKIFEAFENEYGSPVSTMQDGEIQVFELKDCTVILTFKNGVLGVNATADKPIKCDFASGMFVESEDQLWSNIVGTATIL